MARIKPRDMIEELHGKVDSNSDTMFVTNSKTKTISTRKIGVRDTDKHPVTEREVETHTKMHQATKAYHELKQHSEEYQKFLVEYENAVKEGWHSDAYRYFLHQWLGEGKNSVTLKIAKSKSSEESYVEGMSRCQNRDEADRLLLEFVDQLGYHKLVEAYKTIIK